MSSNVSQSWTIDEIAIGNCAKRWLKKQRLLPSSWGLKSEQAKKIREANVRLTIMDSPASFLKLQPNPLKDSDYAGLVIIDVNAFENLGLTREEKITTMLHEIGHTLSTPLTAVTSVIQYVEAMDGLSDDEKAADDFACKCGYGKHIASGLKKLVEVIPNKFNTPAVKARIRRMEEMSE